MVPFGSRKTREGGRRSQRGQSLVELTLMLPLFLIGALLAADFGRAYISWVTLANATRIGANYAANNPSAWPDGSEAVRTRFATLVNRELSGVGCTVVGTPTPQFPDRTYGSGGLPVDRAGDRVIVDIDCQMGIITPVIGQIVGSPVTIGASSTYPVHAGVVVYSTDPSTCTVIADFAGSPRTGTEPLTVSLANTSTGSPTQSIWTLKSGVNTIDSTTISGTGDWTPAPLDAGSYDVELTVTKDCGDGTQAVDRAIRTGYIVVSPDCGDSLAFYVDPAQGFSPLDVKITNTSCGSGPFTWDMGDGTAPIETSGNGSVPSNKTLADGTRVWEYTYNGPTYPKDYTITLSQTGQTSVSNAVRIVKKCTVPNFNNVKVSNAQSMWTTAGFTSTITKLPPPNKGNTDYKINYQSLPGGQVNPPPDGCNAALTVGP